MKKLIGVIKLKLIAGKASSAPPVGSVLGIFKLNIGEFCKDFNSRTAMFSEELLFNVKVFVYNDRSYDLVVTMPSTYFFLQKTCDTYDEIQSIGLNEFINITPELVYELAAIKNLDMSCLTRKDVSKEMFRTIYSSLLTSNYFLKNYD